MQRVKVKEVRGPLGKGEKKFYVVVADDKDNTEFTTFDTKIASLTPGTVINLEPDVKGKWINIKEWVLLEEPPSSPSAPGGPSRSDADRLRFDARVAALTVAGNLAGGGIIPLDKVLHQAELYRVWLIAGTQTKAQPAPSPKADTTVEDDWEKLKRDDEPSGQTEYKRNPEDIKNVDELFKVCHADFNLQPGQIYAEVNVNSYHELKAKVAKESAANIYRVIAEARGW